MDIPRSRYDQNHMDCIISHSWRLAGYHPDISEIDGLLKSIDDTVLEYMNSIEEDEYEIPPGFEDMAQDDDVRFYYGVYFPTSEGRVYGFI